LGHTLHSVIVTQHSRRSFLAAIGAATLATLNSGHPALAALAQRRKLERIGLQLYTVRRPMGADVVGVLEAVAQAGYKEVEFAGYFEKPATEIRALLLRFGLTSPSTHIGLPSSDDAWKAALDTSVAMGHEYVTVPSLPRFDQSTLDGWRQLADRFNKAGALAKAAGLKFAFHNHNAEFRPIQDQIPYDVLVANTDPSTVSFQIDVYWMTVGGQSVVDYMAKFPNRFPMLHLKDRAAPPQTGMVDVGQGNIDFAVILSKAVAQGSKHFFVEHDSPADPIASARASAAYLSRLEF
jgi:sugar phosphate isomerase/epimerase